MELMMGAQDKDNKDLQTTTGQRPASSRPATIKPGGRAGQGTPKCE